MIRTDYSQDAYGSYVSLLIDLHKLMKVGKGDSEEADAMRDEMDQHWYRMSEDEIKRVEGMSADLYTLEPDSPIMHPKDDPERVDANFETKLVESRKIHDLPEVLKLLREQPDQIGAAWAAHLRGTCYADLGDMEVAILFMEEAYKLEPRIAVNRYVLLRLLFHTKHFEKARPLAEQIFNEDSDSLSLYLAAMTMFLHAVSEQAIDRKQMYLDYVKYVDRANKKLIQVRSQNLIADIVVANIWKSLAHDQLEQHKEALAACRFALRLDPNNTEAKKVMNLLHSQNATQNSQSNHLDLSSDSTVNDAMFNDWVSAPQPFSFSDVAYA